MHWNGKRFRTRGLGAWVWMCVVSAIVIGAGAAATAAEQDAGDPTYRVGAGDNIFLSVPQRTDLNRKLVIKPDGSVTLPLIGDVRIGGLTVAEIQGRLLQALQEYYPSIKRIEVSVTAAVSQVIYVSGQVVKPGKYTFSNPVSAWEAIREAGGPTATASLDNVRIIVDRARGGATSVVNVLAAIDGGTIENLPMLHAGDTVIVPTTEELYTGTMGVNVFGAVQKPGVYRLQGRQDLVSAVLRAGGPVQFAELRQVRIVRPRPDGSTYTIEVNMKNFLDHGDPMSNPKLLPGDTVNVPRKSRLVQLATSDVRTLMSLITALATTTLLVITIDNQINK